MSCLAVVQQRPSTTFAMTRQATRRFLQTSLRHRGAYQLSARRKQPSDLTPCYMAIENPPSTGMAAPVTKSDAELDRNAATPAMSAGVPQRP